MDLQTTLAVLAVSAAVAAFCGWRGARQWTVLEGPRLIPWRFMMLLAFACAVIMAKQALTLLGVTPAPRP
jgi:hypothetical protein